jgi:aryl-alcohol dehydrogenase-like predicted oxidoreductase
MQACFGVMTFGNQNTEAQAHEMLDYAWSRGVNFLGEHLFRSALF